jgi:hypothetical protein
MNWSKPYLGVQHLLDVDKSKGQITLTQYATFTEVWVVRRGSFSPIAEVTKPTVEAARRWGEGFARRNQMLVVTR